jgi:hypothetical protein
MFKRICAVVTLLATLVGPVWADEMVAPRSPYKKRVVKYHTVQSVAVVPYLIPGCTEHPSAVLIRCMPRTPLAAYDVGTLNALKALPHAPRPPYPTTFRWAYGN